MSCPDWSLLAARRNRGAEAAGWQEALRHLDGCPLCRRQALAADPTLIFRRLPSLEMGPGQERVEIEATRQAVAVMRTANLAVQARPSLASRLASVTEWRPRQGAGRERRPRQGAGRERRALGLPRLPRLASAAVLALAALSVGSNHAWRESLQPPPLRSAPVHPRLSPTPGAAAEARRRSGAAASSSPAATPASWHSPIERLNRPKARVYQFDGDHMSVVMIVDEKLDV